MITREGAAAGRYCFGGQCLLEMLRMGADLQGVCSFHGLLQSEPQNVLREEGWDGTVDTSGVEDTCAPWTGRRTSSLL